MWDRRHVVVSDPERAIQAIFRLESAKLIAGLARVVRDVGLAEELAQDALVAALEQWPRDGVPENPGAWLMTCAKNRGVNTIRRQQMAARKHEALARDADAHGAHVEDEWNEALDDEASGVPRDDVLRLIFTACHPLLAFEAQVALTLRLVGGLTTDAIARAFLVAEPTIAQRIVRAKRTLAEAKIPFAVPRGGELAPRFAAVLAVVYFIFNEGYSASAGEDIVRHELCEDALRLGRVLVDLAPNDAEAHGLLALMELNASRAATRTNAAGEPVRLLDQNRGQWNWLQIERGLALLERAESLTHADHELRASYTLQAALAACHARARSAGDTDWTHIVALYGELFAIHPSPIVALNRAVAVSMTEGPAAGLALIDEIRDEPKLRDYHLLPSARADLLEKQDRYEDAACEFERAASLTRNARQRERLLERAAACRKKTTP
jgi:predicted RNA polymerase sigma factor